MPHFYLYSYGHGKNTRTKSLNRYLRMANSYTKRIGKGKGYVTLSKNGILVNYLKNDIQGILNPKLPEDMYERFMKMWNDHRRRKNLKGANYEGKSYIDVLKKVPNKPTDGPENI